MYILLKDNKMLPVTRANLEQICCICFLDIRPSLYTQKVYNVNKENNMAKVLKLTALITILKNPINQQYIDLYCQRICETCFIKAQYSYLFREKIMASTATLKELLGSGELNQQHIERLQFFCRICLNRQKDTKDIKYLNMIHLNWMKNCSGIRFTTLIDKEAFRIKEGTNINEIAIINDLNFPRQLCVSCFKKLQNVEEFRMSATQSFEYIISVMGDTNKPEDYQMEQEVKQFKESLIGMNDSQYQLCAKQDCVILEEDCLKYGQEQEKLSTEQYRMHHPFCDMELMINTSKYSTMQPLEDDILQDVIDLDQNKEFSDCSDNSTKSKCLRKAHAKNSKQGNGTNESCLKSKEEITKTSIAFKTKLRCQKSINKSEELCNPQKLSRPAKYLKENKTSVYENMENIKTDGVKETFPCEVCSKMFQTRYAYKRHQRNVHEYDLSRKMYECLICLKKFKRKSHLSDHIKTVHEKLRPFKCSYCAKTFSAKSSKREHELTHGGKYPFVCKWCEKGFRRPSQLKIHSEIHTTNPELLCPICKRSQNSQSDLENHLKSHNDNRLQCPLCGKFFTRNSHFKDHHNAVHLKLRPFKCTFCELSFGDRKTRKSHEKRHTDDPTITCSVCKSGFKTKISLSRHISLFGHKIDNSEDRKKTKQNNTVKSPSSQYTNKLHLSSEI